MALEIDLCDFSSAHSRARKKKRFDVNKDDWNSLRTRKSSRIVTHRAVHVSGQAHISSSSRRPGRESRLQRNTREDVSIPGDAIDCQPARRDLDELHDTSKNLETSLGILRKEGMEKSGSEEPLQSMFLPCFQERAREKGLDDRNCFMSMTNHATGIGTLYSKWLNNSELTFLGDASGKIP